MHLDKDATKQKDFSEVKALLPPFHFARSWQMWRDANGGIWVTPQVVLVFFVCVFSLLSNCSFLVFYSITNLSPDLLCTCSLNLMHV